MAQTEDAKARARAVYQERDEKGLCTRCGGERDMPFGKRCSGCYNLKQTPEKKQRALETDRNRRARLEEFGLCNVCGELPPKDGAKKCEVCTHKSQSHIRRKIDIGICVTCGTNPAESGMLRCRCCLDEINERKKQQNRDRKQRVYEAYGGAVCTCCGETLEQCLAIDHINNDGNEHRKQLKAEGKCWTDMTIFLEKNNYPEGFQILCQNCNWMKFRNGGECPHVQQRKQMELANSLYALDGCHV